MTFKARMFGSFAMAGALAFGLALSVPAPEAIAQKANAAASAPIARGQKIVMATHSFNVFISTDPNRVAPTRTQVVTPGGGAAPAGPAAQAPAAPSGPPLLTLLTNEAGITGQEFLAVQMIGGSTPMQHWNQGNGDDSKNIAKVALNKGGVDVFTMSPNAVMPEPGIDNFGDLVIKTNPNARIMVQSSWSAYDGKGSTPSVGGTGGGTFTNAERDNTTLETLNGWISGQDGRDGYMPKLRAQLEGINKRAGKQMAYVVPSSNAVYTLRKLVVEGKVPGVTKQSALFRDPIGHGAKPTTNLVAYVWFASMYRKSPVGLQALVDKNDPTSAARERILQQIAWNSVVSEPMSGVRGTTVAVGEGARTAAR